MVVWLASNEGATVVINIPDLKLEVLGVVASSVKGKQLRQTPNSSSEH